MKDYTHIISPDDLNLNLDDEKLRIFDARFYLDDTERGINEYRISHIPGASYVNLDRDLSGPVQSGATGRHPLPALRDFKNKLEEWGVANHHQVVVYDQNHGGIAARLWWMMKWVGHSRVAVLDGGWHSWEDKHFSKQRKVEVFEPSNFTLQLPLTKEISRDEVWKMVRDGKGKIIDSRLNQRYTGEIEPIDPVAGHIPGALNFAFPENLSDSGHWKEKEELHKRFQPVFTEGSSTPIAVYCGSGVTACHNLLAMELAGYELPALYAGSWSDWINDPELPVEEG